jgi:hypothetical protein
MKKDENLDWNYNYYDDYLTTFICSVQIHTADIFYNLRDENNYFEIIENENNIVCYEHYLPLEIF